MVSFHARMRVARVACAANLQRFGTLTVISHSETVTPAPGWATVHNLLIKGFAAALVMGAGAGAVTDLGKSKSGDIPRDVLNPMIAGQAMLTGATIYDNASRSPEHTRLVAGMKAAGLAPMLSGNGPYTVFAPTNAAYASQSRAGAAKPESARDVRYLVVPGRYDSQTLLGMINAKGGEVKLKTLEGGTLTAMLNGPTNIVLVDERGQVADISIYDVYQKNGVIQVIDNVLRPVPGGPKLADRS
jgi:uncharacterized surface protein with fasciclin (FAS1) repeats